MHWKLQIEAGATRPDATIVDVTGETLLATIEIDGGDTLACLQQGHSDVQGGGGFTRTALLVAQHNDMCGARLPLTRLHQHDLTPANTFNYARPRSSEMRSYSFETFNVCLDDESQPQLGSALRLTQTQRQLAAAGPSPSVD